MICLTVSLRGLSIWTLPEAQTLLLGALRPRRAQGCYGSRGTSMAVQPTSSQPRWRLLSASLRAFEVREV